MEYWEAPKILKDFTNSGPEETEKYTKSPENHCQKHLDPEKALSLFLEAGLTKSKYNFTVFYIREENCNLFPNNETITKEKTTCYPQDISVTEIFAEVPL